MRGVSFESDDRPSGMGSVRLSNSAARLRPLSGAMVVIFEYDHTIRAVDKKSRDEARRAEEIREQLGPFVDSGRKISCICRSSSHLDNLLTF